MGNSNSNLEKGYQEDFPKKAECKEKQVKLNAHLYRREIEEERRKKKELEFCKVLEEDKEATWKIIAEIEEERRKKKELEFCKVLEEDKEATWKIIAEIEEKEKNKTQEPKPTRVLLPRACKEKEKSENATKEENKTIPGNVTNRFIPSRRSSTTLHYPTYTSNSTTYAMEYTSFYD
jgi:hypothetical protein